MMHESTQKKRSILIWLGWTALALAAFYLVLTSVENHIDVDSPIFRSALSLLLTLLGLLLFKLFLDLVCWVLALPMRRWYGGLLLVEILQEATAAGEPLTDAMEKLAGSRDKRLRRIGREWGSRLKCGLNLDDAAAEVDLPPKLGAMIQIGLRTGRLEQVLPYCRRAWRGDAHSRVRGAANYVPLMALGRYHFPLMVGTTAGVMTLLGGMGGLALVLRRHTVRFLDYMSGGDPLVQAAMSTEAIITVWCVVSCGVFYVLLHLLLEGNQRWTVLHLPGWIKRLDLLASWRRLRAERDFCCMLALLLDAGVDEVQAVELAADATAIPWYQGCAARAADLVRNGIPLAEALACMPGGKALAGRWHALLQRQGDFSTALDGWSTQVSALAFQREQAAAHIISTILYLCWAVIIAFFVYAMLSSLIIFTEYHLW